MFDGFKENTSLDTRNLQNLNRSGFFQQTTTIISTHLFIHFFMQHEYELYVTMRQNHPRVEMEKIKFVFFFYFPLSCSQIIFKHNKHVVRPKNPWKATWNIVKQITYPFFPCILYLIGAKYRAFMTLTQIPICVVDKISRVIKMHANIFVCRSARQIRMGLKKFVWGGTENVIKKHRRKNGWKGAWNIIIFYAHKSSSQFSWLPTVLREKTGKTANSFVHCGTTTRRWNNELAQKCVVMSSRVFVVAWKKRGSEQKKNAKKYCSK